MTQSVQPSPAPAAPPSGSPLSPRALLARWYPGIRCFPCTPTRAAGFIPVLLVLALISVAYVTAIPATLVPLAKTHPLSARLLSLLFHFLFVNILANYLLLVFADPGAVPSDWRAVAPPPRVLRTSPPAPPPEAVTLLPAVDGADVRAAAELERTSFARTSFRYAHLMTERAYDGSLRYCSFCRSYKPDRAHHCSVCRRCILRMDHHCVFVNNCVSFYNHKFFVSFITYALLGCLFVVIVSFRTFYAIIADAPPPLARVLHHLLRASVTAAAAPRTHEHVATTLSRPLQTVAMVGYITCVAFAFALAVFVVFHFYLVAKGRTTIEMYELTDPTRAARVAEFDLGPSRNFRKVFGNVPLCWLLPTRAYVEGDGLHYERRVASDASFAV